MNRDALAAVWLLVLLGGLLALAGCQSQPPAMGAAAATPAGGQPVVLDIGLSNDVTILDPQRTADEDTLDLIENLFAGLTHYNAAAGRIEPELAAAWESREAGRVWRFELRDDVYWVRPGPAAEANALVVTRVRRVVAADMVFTIRRACDARTQTPDVFILFIIQGCQAANRRATPNAADLQAIGVQALDDHTLEVTLTRPAAYFPAIASLSLLRPAPVEVVGEMGEAWTEPESLLTSGPFVLERRSVQPAQTVLRRNPAWPLPFTGNVDRVNVLHLESDTEVYELWADRQVDASPVPAGLEEEVMARNAGRAQLVPQQTVFYLAYNFDSPVFRVPEVRRAFGAAIDREALVSELMDGLGLPMRHLAPPGVIGAPPLDEVGTGYFPDYAREQMAVSGFGDCLFMPPITYLVSQSDQALRQAEFLQETWMRELGCTEEQIIIEQVEFGTLLANTRRDAAERRPDLWDLGWASYFPDEHNWVGDVLHCTGGENRPNRPCGQVDDLIQQAAATADLEARQQLYRQIEQLFFGQGGLEPVTPLYAPAAYTLHQSWLTHRPALFGGEQYDTYVVDAETKQLEKER